MPYWIASAQRRLGKKYADHVDGALSEPCAEPFFMVTLAHLRIQKLQLSVHYLFGFASIFSKLILNSLFGSMR